MNHAPVTEEGGEGARKGGGDAVVGRGEEEEEVEDGQDDLEGLIEGGR